VNIFCDEAGFTGNNLLDAEQDVFTYAAVAIDPETAQERVDRTIRDFRLQGKELKGSRLVKSSQGRRAVTRLLRECEGDFRIVVHLKPYALASKLFEYIFEPPLSNNNSFFYSIEFHKFMSTLLYVHFRVQDKPAEALLADFTKFVRDGDHTALNAMFPVAQTVDYSQNPLHAIGTFAMLHRDTIAEEVLQFRQKGVPNWILDLTTTSFFGLMCHWGERYEVLEVICDASKPLEADLPFFDVMINRKDKARVNFLGKDQAYTFNLKARPTLGSSDQHAGLQLADTVASAATVVFKNRYREIDDVDCDTWAPFLTDALIDNNIWPDLSAADLDQPKCFVNTIVLLELVRRSVAGHDLFRGMPALAREAYHLHDHFLESQRTGMAPRDE